MRLRALLVTVVVAALAPIALVTGPAAAHDVLVSSDPARDATVSGDLDRVTLTLSEPPLAGLQTGIVISVTDAGGTEHAEGDVQVSGSTIARDVDVTDAGPYRVQWRSVSVDGHPISGEYAFTSTGSTASAAPTAAPTATTGATATATDGEATAEPTATEAAAAPADHQHGAMTTVWLVAALVVLALLAVLVTRLVQRRRPTTDAGTD